MLAGLYSFLSVALLMSVTWLSLRRLEQRSLYNPDPKIEFFPSDAGLSFEDLTLTTDDKKKINAWYFAAGAHEPKSRFTVLLSHGNGGNMGGRLDKVRILRALGLDVLLFDYRGYGRSEGVPSEQGTYLDAVAAYNYLISQRQIRAENLILYGESLGTAMATELALKLKGAALILESPFTSVVQMTQRLYPWLPASLVVKYRYETISKIPKIKIPVLIMHAPADETVPYSMGQAVFAAANEPKEFLQLQGGHNDGFSVTTNYQETLQRFIQRL